jgi:hypothetical protein
MEPVSLEDIAQDFYYSLLLGKSPKKSNSVFQQKQIGEFWKTMLEKSKKCNLLSTLVLVMEKCLQLIPEDRITPQAALEILKTASPSPPCWAK